MELSWSRRRQVTIISTVVTIVLALSSVSLYFFLDRPASCSDNKQNQNETGVDCGGICSRLCEGDTKEVIVSWVRLFKIREGTYSVVARLENPNTNSIAKNVPYSFELTDASGTAVAKREGNTFMPSHSSFVVFEGGIMTGSSTPEKVYFKLTATPDWQKSNYIEPTLTISKKELLNEDSSPRLNAVVENRNLSDVDNITLSALIYDDQGVAVQVSETTINKIKADDTAQISFTWPLPISLKSRVCESPVDSALVIDRSGSMNFLSKNPDQPLTDVKNAASYFVGELSKNDQATVVSFGNEASTPIDAVLSSDVGMIKNAILGISIATSSVQNTNIADGIKKATDELLSSRHRSAVGSIMIVLTDGVATRPLKKGDTKYPESSALALAAEAKAQGIRIFTIGLGKDLNQDFLKKVAATSSDFYLAPTAKELTTIYHEIGTKMCIRRPTSLEIVTSVPLQ